jgi:hypothetical protein
MVSRIVRSLRSVNWEAHYFGMLLVTLVLVGTLFVEAGKRHQAELDRQRAYEMVEIEKDKRYNDSLID